MRERPERSSIMAIQNETCNVVTVIRYENIRQQFLQWQIGEPHLRSHAFLGAFGSDSRKCIAGTKWRRFREQRLEIAEHKPLRTYDLPIFHHAALRRSGDVIRFRESTLQTREDWIAA